jgi:hypothetical protein
MKRFLKAQAARTLCSIQSSEGFSAENATMRTAIRLPGE